MDLSKSTSKLFIANVVNAVAVFVGTAYFAHYLTPGELGAFFLFEATLGIISLIADAGLREGIEKRISEGEAESGYFSSGVVAKTLLIALIASLLLLFHDRVNTYVGLEVAWLLAIALFLREFALLQIHALRGNLRVGATAPLVILKRGVWFLLGIILIHMGYGTIGLIYSTIAGYATVLVVGWTRSSLAFASPSLFHVRSILKYSKFSFISAIGGYSLGWVDVLFIGALMTQDSVGIYEVSWKTSTIALLLSRAVSTTLFPQISSWKSSSSNEHLSKSVSEAILPSVGSVLPIFAGGIILSGPILSVVFGVEYSQGRAVLMILLAATLFRSIHVLFSRTIQAIGLPEISAKVGLLSAALNVVLNFILITHFGIKGAAIATTLSIIFGLALHFHHLQDHVEIQLPVEDLAWVAAATILMSGAVLLGKRFVNAWTWGSLFALIASGGLIFMCGILFNPKFRSRLVILVGEYI